MNYFKKSSKWLSTIVVTLFCLCSCNGVGVGAINDSGFNTQKSAVVSQEIQLSQIELKPQPAVRYNATPMNASSVTVSISPMVNYKSIAYGNGKYIIVGDAGTILTSTNGVSWASLDTKLNVNLNSVTFVPDYNTFYVVGAAGTVLTSSDGVNWTTYDPSFTALNLQSITSGAGYVIIAADSGTVFEINPKQGNKIMQITNPVIANADENMISSAYGNGMFVIGGDQGSILYNSSNTLSSPTWYRATQFPSISINGLNFNTNYGLFLAAGSTGHVFISDVGWTSWSTQLVTTSNLNDITVDSTGLFIVVGQDARIITSTNLYNWNVTNPVNSVASINKIQCVNQNCYSVGENSTILFSASDMSQWFILGYETQSIISNPLYIYSNGQANSINVSSNNVTFKVSNNSDRLLDNISFSPSQGSVYVSYISSNNCPKLMYPGTTCQITVTVMGNDQSCGRSSLFLYSSALDTSSYQYENSSSNAVPVDKHC